MQEQLFACSDLILQKLDSVESYPIDAFSPELQGKGVNNLVFQKTLKLLEYENLIEINSNRGVRLTGKGISFVLKAVSIRFYFEHLDHMKKLEKDVKDIQIRFQNSGIRRDERQRWQFWLTLLLGAGGFILGIINFIKGIFLP